MLFIGSNGQVNYGDKTRKGKQLINVAPSQNQQFVNVYNNEIDLSAKDKRMGRTSKAVASFLEKEGKKDYREIRTSSANAGATNTEFQLMQGNPNYLVHTTGVPSNNALMTDKANNSIMFNMTASAATQKQAKSTKMSKRNIVSQAF